MGGKNISRKARIRVAVKHSIMNVFNIHRPDERCNVFIFSSPRSGSTWLMELIMTQPGFKYCDEPFNLRTPEVRYRLGIDQWKELYAPGSERKIFDYFSSFINGKPCLAKLKHSVPTYKYYRPVTHRIVFKILHAGEDRISWFGKNFHGHIIYLLRHPIPVSISRQYYPRLESLLNSDYIKHFTISQKRLARRIINFGTKLEKGVLSWCLQNAVPIKNREKEWTFVTYEQMVLDPLPVLRTISQKLELPSVDRMADRLVVPSQTTWQSDQNTKHIFEATGQDKNLFLVEKWRKQVNPELESQLLGICKAFEIDVYQNGEILPKKNWWLS
ncbi:sulfotransferase domain-containing protein [candidate division KSB1 bacterium]|nr:sulfotransferase domain-containing protein [candidate division KSB1 bacterium]